MHLDDVNLNYFLLKKSQDFVAKEMTRLRKSGVTCPLSVLSLSSLDRLRVTGEVTLTFSCQLQSIFTSKHCFSEVSFN